MEDGEEKDEVIPANIVAFWHDGRYVCAKTVNPENTEAYRDEKTVGVQYYVLDTLTNEITGPFDEENTFQALVKTKYEITGLNYTDTAPKPEAAKYYID